jgi:hypothetical protein
VQQFFSFLSLDFFILTSYFTRKNGKDRLLRFSRPETAAVVCSDPEEREALLRILQPKPPITKTTSYG